MHTTLTIGTQIEKFINHDFKILKNYPIEIYMYIFLQYLNLQVQLYAKIYIFFSSC